MTQTRIDDPFEVRCTTVGRDYEFTEVKVIDPETGEECPVGVQGEMCNRGYNTMKGYYKNPQATAETIDANGWLHSGDLGVKDENGNYLYPINNDRNNELYAKYLERSKQDKDVIFGGRLGTYKYYDMDAVIASALEMCEKELANP